MKILVIPDIHQTEHYKDFLKEYFDNVGRVVFLGDYFDYHDDAGVVSTEKAVMNFQEIANLARLNPDKVDILIGNHDNEYVSDDMTNTYQYRFEALIGKVLRENLDVLKVAVKIDNYVFSHAGISDVFLYMNGFADKRNGKVVPFENSIDLLNEKFHKEGADFLCFSPFDMSGYGDDKTSSPTWIRPNSLLQHAAYPLQVVGHTAIGENGSRHAYFEYRGNKVIFTDTNLKNIPLIIDTKKQYDFYDVEKKGKQICHIVKIKVEKTANSEIYSYKIVTDLEEEPVLYRSMLEATGLEKTEISEYIDSALEELAEVCDLCGEIPAYEIM